MEDELEGMDTEDDLDVNVEQEETPRRRRRSSHNHRKLNHFIYEIIR